MGSLIKPLVQKIAFECEEAGATKWDIAKIVKELNEIETQSERKLKEKAIEMLRDLNPKAAETYSSFDRMIVFTSKQETEAFDRGNITKSLLKETKIKRGLAEKISNEVEEKIKNLKISNLTTSLIREMVCVKLLELGFEDIHNQYTRVGMPVFEVDKTKEHGKEVLMEFNLISKIPFKAKEMHFDSTINIPFIEDFNSKGFSFNISLKEKEEQGEKIIIDLLKEVKEKQKEFSSGVCVDYLNFCLSHSLKNKSSKKIRELIEFFFDASKLTEKKFCVSIALFTPQESDYKSNKKSIWFFANTFIKMFNEKKQENFDLIVCLENKFQLKLLEENALTKEIYFLSLKNNNLKAQEKGLYVKGQGIFALNEINMEKLFFNSKRDAKKLMNEIEETVDVINELFLAKESVKEKINLTDLKKCISLYGVKNGAVLFCEGNKIEAKTIARRAREKVRKQAGNAIVLRSYTSAKGKQKFEKFNQKNFNIKKEEELKTTSYVLVKTKKELEEAIEKNFESILFKPD